MGQTITYPRPDGKDVPGYLCDAGADAPGVVVIQEWWGMNDQIRGVAQRLADAGYTALVPDLYRGQSTVEAEEAHHLMSGLDFGDAASQDVRGAVQFLKRSAPKVAVTGFCMGGALTVLSLCHAPELDAGIVWYGCPPLEFVDASKIAVPVLGHFATQDEFFKIEAVDQLEARLKDAKVDVAFHRYLAHHAFANETAIGPRRMPATQYDAAWAQTAWDRSFDFLGRHLR